MVAAVGVLVLLIAGGLFLLRQPDLVRRRDLGQDHLDESLRWTAVSHHLALPLSVALHAAVSAVAAHLQDRSSWPWWSLACFAALGLAVVMRTTRPRIRQTLLDLGARPDDPGSDRVRRRRRSVRWFAASLWLSALGRSLDRLADVDGLGAARAPGIALTFAAIVTGTVPGWRLLTSLPRRG